MVTQRSSWISRCEPKCRHCTAV